MLIRTWAWCPFHARRVLSTCTVVLILNLVACGGGGGGSGGSGSGVATSSPAPPSTSTSITGVVAKGLVSGATVTAYCGGQASGATLGAAAITDANGNYNITSTSACNEPVELVATTGADATELDEASGTTAPATFTLKAYLATLTATNVQHITPLSDVAAAIVDAQTGVTPTSATVTTAANVIINNVLNGDAATFNATPMTPAQAIASGNQADLRLAYLLTALSAEANTLTSVHGTDGIKSLSDGVERVLDQMRTAATGNDPGPNLVQLWEGYIGALWTGVPLTGPSAVALVVLAPATPTLTVPGSGSTTFGVGGTISGLTGSGLVLQDSLGESLSVTANGTFTFLNRMTTGSNYSVRVQTEPSGQLCTIANGTVGVLDTDVTTVAVTCAAAYSIGGSVSGLASGATVVLNNTNGDTVSVTANGTFTFPTLLASGAPWTVTVGKLPKGQGCNITNGSSGVAETANSTAIRVACQNVYTITADVSGLAAGGTLTLELKSGGLQQFATVTSNGAVSFPTGLPNAADFEVFATSTPSGQGCTGMSSNVVAGANNAADNGITVTCANGYFTVGGTVSGLAPGSTLVLSYVTPLAEWNPTVTITGNGAYTLPEPVLGRTTSAEGTYVVTFASQPANQNCVWGLGDGSYSAWSYLAENLTTLNIVCTTAYVITGQIGTSSGGALSNGSVTITGTTDFPGTTTTSETAYLDGSGYFQFIAPTGTYTVTPDTGGGQASFSPASASVTLSDANPAALTFTCVSGCPGSSTGSGGSVGGGTGSPGGGGGGSGGTGTSYTCNFSSCTSPLASSCVTQFNDPSNYNWVSFTNSSCGQAITLTYDVVGTGYGTAQMNLSSGQSATTGFASSEVPNGILLAVCPYGYNPWNPAANSSWNGSGTFICVK